MQPNIPIQVSILNTQRQYDIILIIQYCSLQLNFTHSGYGHMDINAVYRNYFTYCTAFILKL